MVISVNNLSKDYLVNGKKINVLNNISFSVDEGEMLVITGPSGVGKSTILRCINLLDTPTSGEILFLDKSIYDYDIEYLRRNIGIVFQNYDLFPHLSVKDNITLAPVSIKLLNKTHAEKKAIELLKKLNIAEKIDSYPEDLSGGQKQRVSIARALIMNPKVMLFDEPTSALDTKASLEIISIIKDLMEKQITVIVVTHELSFFENVATQIINIENTQDI